MLPGQVPVLNLKPFICAYKQTSPLVESALEALSTFDHFLVTKAVTVQGSWWFRTVPKGTWLF